MKKQLVFIALLISGLGIAQSINDYKAVIIPLKYEFMKSDNQYRLATLTKFNLNKAGFEAYYTNEEKPMGLGDRCGLLDLDVINEKAFLTTKLYVVFKDCYGNVVYKSELGSSREKSYEVAYSEALNRAFESITALEYKYSGKVNAATPAGSRSEIVRAEEVGQNVKSAVNTVTTIVNVPSASALYAQPITNGFQLVDSTPSVVMKIQKTAKADYFLAQKGNTNGVMYKKDNDWFFEYYQGETLMSEKVDVKF
ncbi:MAG: hypothetical protein K2Y30_10225 [Flavobacteriaceae bacterium]|jgi:hypothetical protein|nr:hypothetical protein [Flavobacteriaceae bacterium]